MPGPFPGSVPNPADQRNFLTARHCPTCLVGWNDRTLECWFCGAPGVVGALPSQFQTVERGSDTHYAAGGASTHYAADVDGGWMSGDRQQQQEGSSDGQQRTSSART